jgi:hypothetical protein
VYEYTIEELKEKLASQLDETTLLEILGINTYSIVEKYTDLIEENYTKLIGEVE